MYHINKNGVVSKCNAKKKPCPLGGNFDSISEANDFLNKELKSDTKQEQLLNEKEKLTNELKNLKGLKKLKANTELKRIEYALEGRDYDKEMKKEREKREESVEKQKQKDIESKMNAEILSNKETLELPQSIEQYVVRGKWTRTHISAYRGEQNKDSQTNTGFALYGQGKYTTTDKSYAKKFGNVRNVELEELPENPLRLRTVGGFQLLEQEIARNNNINYRDLYAKMDVSDMITKMGYDGLTLGTGKDMIIVKYFK